MKNVKFLIYREFALFWQNKVFVIAFLFMPLLLATMLGFVYQDGKVTKLRIVIVDRDQSPFSASLSDRLLDNQTLNVVSIIYEAVDLYQTMLNKRAVAVVVIPYRFEANILLNKRPEINCYLNMANTLTAGAAGGAVQLCTSSMNAAIQIGSLQKKGIPGFISAQQYESFHHNVFQQYNPASNYLMFLWPGFIFSILHQLLLLATAVVFSQDLASNNFNQQGLLKYSHSAGILVFVKIFPYCMMSLLTIGVYFVLGIFFKMPPPVHPEVLFISAALMCLGTCLLGSLYSIVYPLPLKATQTLMSIASPAFSISGFTWPSDQLPVVLKYISDIIPLTPFLKILRLCWLQDASLKEITPYMNHQLILIASYLLLTILLLSKNIRKSIKQETVKPILADAEG